jgi:pimeloyl-ACP methyl ester carboxylesterase/predicted glycosyltransferase
MHAIERAPEEALAPTDAPREQTRARHPDLDGYVERDGVRVHWESYGEGPRTILFLPPWSIVHSRIWKAQIHYLARHARVLTFDPRGNGRSDRPKDLAAYTEQQHADDALAVLDATNTDRATIVGLSRGAQRGMLLAGDHPERVENAVFFGPMFPVSPVRSFHVRMLGTTIGQKLVTSPPLVARSWAKFNTHYWRSNWRDFAEWFFGECLPEKHSTKQIEDAVGWALETDGETAATFTLPSWPGCRREQLEMARRVRCPVTVIHGTKDKVCAPADGKKLAEITGGRFVPLEGVGHLPMARKPVAVNLLLREIVAPSRPVKSLRKSGARKRALFISSPIGLGHAQRDVAIAKALRERVPGLEIDWLAQDPVTRVLRAEGERIHPASALLASEVKHIESESAEHDLHCFQAIRRMDEILIANFMVFHDIVREDAYDLWIGDEAWELDYYLHENPNEKRAPFAWLTDFVGWLPFPDGGPRESALTADYNAQMVEHIAEQPTVRDRAVFVGNLEDIVHDRLGPDLPFIRDWTKAHFDFSGYITGFDPRDFSDREALRAQLGYRTDEKICIVSVGGSGVGLDLLRRIVAAYPHAKRQVPDLRMIVVTGPRIDPASLGAHPGLEVVAYVHHLYRHLAACDLALVQGGLSTAMELCANKRPFIYFPLRHHFEQNFHVRHRLAQYGAGRAMDFDQATPEVIAAAIREEIGRKVGYRDVETDGARKAADRIAELL